jgi:hypothetical protein
LSLFLPDTTGIGNPLRDRDGGADVEPRIEGTARALACGDSPAEYLDLIVGQHQLDGRLDLRGSV